MAKFLCTHTFPKGALTRDQLNQFAQAGQQDPQVKGYRSFVNLTEGKAVCIMEAATQELVTAWFQKVKMPVDSVVRLEFEGERGTVTER